MSKGFQFGTGAPWRSLPWACGSGRGSGGSSCDVYLQSRSWAWISIPFSRRVRSWLKKNGTTLNAKGSCVAPTEQEWLRAGTEALFQVDSNSPWFWKPMAIVSFVGAQENFPGYPKITNCSFIGDSFVAIKMVGVLATLIWAIEAEFVFLLEDLSLM